jgi:hypothetical protein
VNQPLELTPAASVSEAVAESRPVAPATPAAAPAPPPRPPLVQVCVKVPRRFYIRAVGRREPTREELQPLIGRTEGLIQKYVKLAVPEGQLVEPVLIDTIPDEAPADEPPPLPPASALRSVPWWVPAAVAGAATATVLAVAFGVLVARRPTFAPVARGEARGGRYKIDGPADAGAGPNPSEKVRELIRLNPEAAASVLHRWTGQGGTVG